MSRGIGQAFTTICTGPEWRLRPSQPIAIPTPVEIAPAVTAWTANRAATAGDGWTRRAGGCLPTSSRSVAGGGVEVAADGTLVAQDARVERVDRGDAVGVHVLALREAARVVALAVEVAVVQREALVV